MKRRAGKRLIGVMTAGFVLLILILITIGVLQDSSQNKRTYKIIMVPKTIDESNDFWTGLIEGAKLGAEEFGCEIEVVGSDSEDDYEGQNRLIEESYQEESGCVSDCAMQLYTYDRSGSGGDQCRY